ncbi:MULTISPECIES: SulP family inorganic anion transporter [Thiorhodovibrio]|uniref:SulP family inorganic anion transporter n=1 Tax=Thiorhodovibrio TaxID=61593 RepID=UPI001F5CE140|nr:MULTISPECIES: SulP family inorganic anion transporter [Thiorhodovibrio]MBK5967216.1 hypothetical protein [Thiorhodovibrio winogradskyi]WPL14893.1 putative sulfate transporter [Thiorhodovibrio litoralis]
MSMIPSRGWLGNWLGAGLLTGPGGYGRDGLRLDLIAGLTTAAVVIPKAMAYATIAGLPVQVGLYTALVPLVIYAILGTSRPLSVTTTTTLAILTGAQLALVVPSGEPAALLTASATLAGLLAGFGQIESSVIKVGMIGEVACMAKPWQIVPMVVTEVQPVIATGQVKPTDTLVDLQQMGRPGSITAVLEPLYPGQLDDLPLGGNCIANLYTSHHEQLADPDIGFWRSLGLHAIDTIGLVHALILRIQSLLMPIKMLVLTGH